MGNLGGHDMKNFGGHDMGNLGGHDMKNFGGHDMGNLGGYDMKNFGGHDMKNFGGHDMKNFGGHDMGDLYDVKDVQKILSVSRNSAYGLIRRAYANQQPFRVLKIGNLYRIPKEPFDRWRAGK